VAVWTGTELVVWGGAASSGGGPTFADGAAYRPGTQTWRTIPDAPIGARERHGAVWTGREVIVWGGDLGAGARAPATGAAWDPATDAWRTIAAAPIDAVQYPSMVWTGTEVVVAGGVFSHDAAAYDPATDRWRALAPVPGADSAPGTAPRTGSHVVTTIAGFSGVLQVATLDPATGRWTTSPALPADRVSVGQAVWAGDRRLVLGPAFGRTGTVAEAWDPATATWVDAGHGDVSSSFAFESRPPAVPLVWTGRLVVASGVFGLTYEPGTGSWQRLSYPPTELVTGGTAVWTGDAVIWWGGTRFATHDGPNGSRAGGVAFRPGG
jgi:hypothetical protein